MKHIEDAPEQIQKKYKEAWDIFIETNSNRFPNLICGDFFLAGYEAAIAERAKFNIDSRYVGTLSFGSRLKDFKDIILQDAAFEDEEPRKYKYRITVEEI